MAIDEGGLRDREEVDVLIVGAGIAGCAAALRAAELGRQPLLLCRAADLMESNSAWAQGGIIYEGEGDSSALLVDDILEAGAGLCYPPSVRLLAEEGPRRVRHFLLGDGGPVPSIPFDRNPGGALNLTEEAAHSLPRIIHVGDRTGRAIQEHLTARVATHPNIRVASKACAVDLLTNSHHGQDPADRYAPSECLGAYVLSGADYQVRAILAKETILATGGLGQIFLHTTNTRGARGDGIAMAARAGARLANLEFVQFHPTALYTEHGRRLLITEALRGEGGRLIDAEGREFMRRYDPRGELAPRDVVARAIHAEMLVSGAECVFLDISHKPAAWLRERFPGVTEICARHGINITAEPIPVVPAAHYSCGGVLTDLDGLTSLDRLWVAGEAACTGVHGANRLASTSLLEGLVWGARAAEAIERRLSEGRSYADARVPDWVMSRETPDPALMAQDWMTIRQTMWNYVGLERAGKRLRRARQILRELESEIEAFYEDSRLTDELIGLRNGVFVARMVARSALANRKSRGCHYRVD
jgi:L-aspartate oxidase